MEPKNKYYIAIAILLVLIVGGSIYLFQKATTSEGFEFIKRFDIKYKSCVAQCDSIIALDPKAIDRCKEQCNEDYKKRHG